MSRRVRDLRRTRRPLCLQARLVLRLHQAQAQAQAQAHRRAQVRHPVLSLQRHLVLQDPVRHLQVLRVHQARREANPLPRQVEIGALQARLLNPQLQDEKAAQRLSLRIVLAQVLPVRQELLAACPALMVPRMEVTAVRQAKQGMVHLGTTV